jgi:hypothetical protein
MEFIENALFLDYYDDIESIIKREIPDLSEENIAILLTEFIRFLILKALNREYTHCKKVFPSLLINKLWEKVVINTKIYEGLCFRISELIVGESRFFDYDPTIRQVNGEHNNTFIEYKKVFSFNSPNMIWSFGVPD